MLTLTQAFLSWPAPSKRDKKSSKWNNAWMTLIILKRLICKSAEEIDKSKEDGDMELLVSIMQIHKTPQSSTRMQRKLKTTVWMRKPLSMVEGLKHLRLDLAHQAKCQWVLKILKGLRVYYKINQRRLLISAKSGRLKTSWLDLRLSLILTKEFTSLRPISTETQRTAAWKKSNLRDHSNWERKTCEIAHST